MITEVVYLKWVDRMKWTELKNKVQRKRNSRVLRQLKELCESALYLLNDIESNSLFSIHINRQ